MPEDNNQNIIQAVPYSATTDLVESGVAVTDIIVVQQTDGLAGMKKTTVGDLLKPAYDKVDELNNSIPATSDAAAGYISKIEQVKGKVSAAYTHLNSDLTEQENYSVAPTSGAVVNYINKAFQPNGLVNTKIMDAINSLDCESTPAEGYFIKSIKQTDGKIEPTTGTIASAVGENNGNDVASVGAVKNYVTAVVNGLDAAYSGDGLISGITQTGGKITGVVSKDIDSTVSNDAAGVPSTKAVYNALAALNASVGVDEPNSLTLVQSITQTNGKVSGETINVSTDLNASETNATIPTTQAVKNYVDTKENAAIKAIGVNTVGGAGSYIRSIGQEEGEIKPTATQFVTTIDTNTNNNNNAPTTQAVKTYVDNTKGQIETGLASEVTRATEAEGTLTTNLASEVTRAEAAEKAINDKIGAMGYSDSQSEGFVYGITQADGRITSVNFNTFKKTIDNENNASDSIAPTELAVRKAINALGTAEIKSDTGFIKSAKQVNGILSATTNDFITYDNWDDNKNSDSVIPSVHAVEQRSQALKDEILQSTEAMVYRGTVSSYEDISAKTAFQTGDVYISNGSFNLEGAEATSEEYNVRPGDMLIAKAVASAYDKGNFDIVRGSSSQVNGPADPVRDLEVVVWDGTTGRSVKSSGLTIDSVVGEWRIAAKEQADLAEGFKNDAEGFKDDASAAASAAETSKDEAANSASAALLEATSAEGNSRLAEDYALAAADAKNYAKDYASAAETSKDEAVSSAAAALISKNSAAEYAAAASIDAESVKQAEISAEGSVTTINGYVQTITTFKNTAEYDSGIITEIKSNAESAIQEINGLKTSAENAYDNAKANIEKLANAATEALNNAEAAETSKDEAVSSAAAALSSKNSAAEYAAAALSFKNSAEKWNTTAYTAAEDAVEQERVAHLHAFAAQASAEEAANYADSANLAGIKQAAESARDDARNSASAAQASASAAQTSAEEAAEQAREIIETLDHTGSNDATRFVYGVDEVDGVITEKTRSFDSTDNTFNLRTSGKVYDAAWNDIVDIIKLDDEIVEPGYCYAFNNGHYVKTGKYAERSYMGIHSDTYGFALGGNGADKEFNVAIGGFVLAHIDKEYKAGTPLTCTKDGKVTKAKLFTRLFAPEMVIATYWKPETESEWGPEGKKIKVNGRHWIKIK